LAGALPLGGALLPLGGACGAVLVVVVDVEALDDPEDAALAIAAPPPATAPVTASITSVALSRCRIGSPP
jgi:hypothetical protein